METAGTIVFASLMATVSLQLIVSSFEQCVVSKACPVVSVLDENILVINLSFARL